MINLLLSLALSATSPGAAATEPPASTGTGQPAKPAKPRKICERIEITGSTVPKRVCRTVVEPAKPVAEAGRADNAPSAGDATN